VTSRTEEMFGPQVEPARVKRSERSEACAPHRRALAGIEGAELVIRVSINNLPVLFESAIGAGAILPDLDGHRLEIIDCARFAAALANELNTEEDDGATVIDGALDKAMEMACYQPAEDTRRWLRCEAPDEPAEHDCGEDTCVCADRE
jgi:hypothetical protein